VASSVVRKATNTWRKQARRRIRRRRQGSIGDVGLEREDSVDCEEQDRNSGKVDRDGEASEEDYGVVKIRD